MWLLWPDPQGRGTYSPLHRQDKMQESSTFSLKMAENRNRYSHYCPLYTLKFFHEGMLCELSRCPWKGLQRSDPPPVSVNY